VRLNLRAARLSPAPGPDAAAELEDDDVEEGAGAGVSLADCDGKFMPPLDSGADGDGTAAATSCRWP
jgi:hypothetical protein